MQSEEEGVLAWDRQLLSGPVALDEKRFVAATTNLTEKKKGMRLLRARGSNIIASGSAT